MANYTQYRGQKGRFKGSPKGLRHWLQQAEALVAKARARYTEEAWHAAPKKAVPRAD